MSKGSKERELIKELTNDVQSQKYQKEVGSRATVQREIISNDHTAALQEVLSDIGRDLEGVGAVPKGMQYQGSAAVHIFVAPVTGTVAYYNQLALGSCPEALAGPAFSDLRGSAMEYFNRGRQKKRSGF